MQVDKGRMIREVLTRLAKLSEGEALFLQPFKKDRVVCLVLVNGVVRVVERGFVEKDYVVEVRKLKKELKILCRREFPRSNKVWLQCLTREEVGEFLKK